MSNINLKLDLSIVPEIVKNVVKDNRIRYLFNVYDNGNNTVKQITWAILMRIPTITSLQNEAEMFCNGTMVEKHGSELLYFTQILSSFDYLPAHVGEWSCQLIISQDDVELIEKLSQIYVISLRNGSIATTHLEAIEKCIECVENNAVTHTSVSILENAMKMVEIMEGSEQILNGTSLYDLYKKIIISTRDNAEFQPILPLVGKAIVDGISKNETFVSFINSIVNDLPNITSIEQSPTIISQYYLVLSEIVRNVYSITTQQNLQQYFIPVENHIFNVLKNSYEDFSKRDFNFPYCILLLELMIGKFGDDILLPLSQSFIQKLLINPSLIKKIHYYSQKIMNLIDENHPKQIIPIKEAIINTEHRQGHVGLLNLGTTCYVNAALQQLYNMIEFRKEILGIECDRGNSIQIDQTTKNVSGAMELEESKSQHATNNQQSNMNDDQSNPTTKTMNDKYSESNQQNMEIVPFVENNEQKESINDPAMNVVRELQKLFIEMSCGAHRTYSPSNLIDAIQIHKHRHDLKSSQHDTGDFLTLLFDCIEDATGSTKIFNSFTCELWDCISSLDSTIAYEKKRTSEVRILFLPLQMSIESSIESYFREEIFDGDNLIRTDQDNLIVAKKQSSFKTHPKYLLLQLNRFGITPDFTQTIKNNEECLISETIDLSPYGSDEHYELTGVIVHTGGANAGHYFSFIKTEEGWLECNDTNVSSSSLTRVIESSLGGGSKTSGYIMIYSKISNSNNLMVEDSVEFEQNEMTQNIVCNDIELLRLVIGGSMNLHICLYIENVLTSSREDALYLIDTLILSLQNIKDNIVATERIQSVQIEKWLIECTNEKVRIRTMEYFKWLIQNAEDSILVLFTRKLFSLLTHTRKYVDCLKQYFSVLYESITTSSSANENLIKYHAIDALVCYVQGTKVENKSQKLDIDIFKDTLLPDLSSFTQVFSYLITCCSVNDTSGKYVISKYVKETIFNESFYNRLAHQSTTALNNILRHLCYNNYAMSLKVSKHLKKQINNQRENENVDYSLLETLKGVISLDDLFNSFRCYIIFNNIKDVLISPSIPQDINEMNNGILSEISKAGQLNSAKIDFTLSLIEDEKFSNVKEVLFEMNSVIEEMTIHIITTIKEKFAGIIGSLNINLEDVTIGNVFVKLFALSLNPTFTADVKKNEIIMRNMTLLTKLYSERCEYLKIAVSDEEVMDQMLELKNARPKEKMQSS
ncbi:Ubiquitin carboxyl-terminal hydrolase [Entamoeba marina]